MSGNIWNFLLKGEWIHNAAEKSFVYVSLTHRIHISSSNYESQVDKLSLFCIQSGGDDDPMSDPDLNSRGEEDDGDSLDTMARIPTGDIDPETLEKLRRQVNYHC